jgi:hypothetical protein
MRPEPLRLVAAALAFAASTPLLAQPTVVGDEIAVNEPTLAKSIVPMVASAPSGGSVVVWENSTAGVMARTFDRNGDATSPERVLVANRNLAGIPASGEVLLRREPSVVVLPNGEVVAFWTEQRTYLSVDHFWEDRQVLDEDVWSQRFSAALQPLGPRLRVNVETAGFQRRPRASFGAGTLVVAWESSDYAERDATGVHARLLTRRGRPMGNEVRADAGDVPELWNAAVAINQHGEVLVVWEVGDARDTDVMARRYGRGLVAAGEPFVANRSVAGRQRRPAVVANAQGDFLVAWQSWAGGGAIHGIRGQLYSRTGAVVGAERAISVGTGEVQISPALALLPSGRVVAAWMDWVNTTPIGAFAVVLDGTGQRLGDEVKVSEQRLYPQYQLSVSASPTGEVMAVWEGRGSSRRQNVNARLLEAN